MLSENAVPESAQASSGSTTGIFRSFLNNVGTSVAGGGSAPSVSSLENRIKKLSEEVCVLQEELESKILENERLVIESSDVKREMREIEDRCNLREKEVSEAGWKLTDLMSQLDQVLRQNSVLSQQKETDDIKVDSLRREVELGRELVTQVRESNSNLSRKLEQAEAELRLTAQDLRELRAAFAGSQSKADQYQRQASESEMRSNQLMEEMFQQKTLLASQELRMKQLEDELAVRIATSSQARQERLASATPCHDDPCCYRSEHFQARCRTLEASICELKKR